MSLVTLEQAKAQSRVTSAAEDTLLQSYIDAAEQKMVLFLNRNVYADSQALMDAVESAQTAVEGAYAAFGAATDAAHAMEVGPLREIALTKASDDWNDALEAYRMAARGTTLQPAMVQAVQLLVAGWYANRESMAAGDLPEIPLGAVNLLAPFRVRMGA